MDRVQPSDNWPAATNGQALSAAIWAGQDQMPGIASEPSRDMGMWHNSAGAAWGVSPSNNDIIVDSQDKEAWPSIGHNSESASEADDNDNASVNSASVITSSSNSGLPTGSATPTDATGAGKANSNSAVWGPTFASDMTSQSPWGSSPASSQMNSSWSSASQSTGLTSSNMLPGYDMTRTAPTSASASMGWGGFSMDTKGRMDGWQASSSDNSNWGQPQNLNRPDSSGWGALPPAAPNPNAGTEGWGRPTEKPPPQAWGGANPASQPSSASGWGQPQGPPPSRWGEAGAGAADGGVPGWGAGPAGSKPPGPGGPASGTFPNTWAQAACKGLPPQDEIKSLTPPCDPPVPLNPKEQYIANVINSHEGWGKRPIRQDTSWEIEDSPRQQRRNSGSDDGSHWPATNNNGTAIWEGAKDGPDWQRQQQQQQQQSGAAAAAANEWTADNDHGTWRGPPGEPPPNQWSRPPPSTSGTEQWSMQQPPQNQWEAPPQSNMQYQQPKVVDNSHWNNPKEDNMWDRNGTQQWTSSSSSSQSEWGGDSSSSGEKMETGTWSSRGGRRPSSSSWGDPSQDSSGWDGQSPTTQRRDSSGMVDDGTSFWGNPQESHKPQWPGGPPNGPMPSQMRGMPPEKMPPMWAAPPPSSRNWGEPSMGGGKPEDQPMWMQQHPRPPSSQWAEPQWASSGKAKAGWGQDPGDMYRKIGEGMQPGWGASAQPPGAGPVTDDEGSTPAVAWTAARDWSTLAHQAKPSYMLGGRSQQPQMRSKMLQQLVEMGFKRDDAQNALITHNMNLESAIADLIRGAKQIPGRRMHPPDQLGDHGDPSQFPNAMPGSFSGTATPLSAQVLGHQLNKNPNLTIPQKLMALTAGANAAQNPNPHLRQAVQKQQMISQLRMAAASGLIPQQLLSQQLTQPQIVHLQRLLELQKTYHNLVTNQQMLQQQVLTGKTNPMLQSQLEQVTLTIPKIKEQVFQLQQQIAAQQMPAAASKPSQPPNVPGADSKDLKEIQSNLAALQMPKEPSNPVTSQPQQQPQQESRFAKWILGGEKEGSNEALNRAPGSKPQTSTASSPNLPSKSEAVSTASSLLLSSDSTWSSLPGGSLSSQSSWPSASSAPATSTTDAQSTSEVTASKESPTSSSTSSASTPSVASAVSAAHDMIPEFVPGKPWQGLTKSVEDDPHVTPGSVSRPSLSVNTIRDDYVMTTLGKSTSPSVGSEGSGDSPAGASTWSFGGLGRPASSAAGPRTSWSSTSSLSEQTSGQPASLTSDLWGTNLRNVRPPPGLPNAKTPTSSSGWQQQYNRSMSWAPGDNRTMTMQGAAGQVGWGSVGSSALVLKNLPQMDSAVLKTLCGQHGPLRHFVFHAASGQALIRYNTREEAAKAQKSLNGCILHNSTMMAEFLSEADAERLDQLPALQNQAVSAPQSAGYNSPPSMWPASGYRPQKDMSQWNGTSFGGSMWGSDLWSTGPENHSFLSNDLLGSQ